MSTAAQVRAAFNNNVFNDATITAITTRIYDYAVREVAEKSTTHLALLRDTNTDYHFIQYHVGKSRQYVGTNEQEEWTYPVTIEYFKQATPNGTEKRDIEDFFETLEGVINSWSNTWGDTVDFYRRIDSEPLISNTEIDGRDIWQGSYSYIGYKRSV